MKKLLLGLVFILLSQFSFAQIETGTCYGDEVDIYEWSSSADDYKHQDGAEVDVEFYFSDRYCTITVDGDKDKYYWEYMGTAEEYLDIYDSEWDVYETTDEETRIVINYEDQEVWIFEDFSNSKQQFEELAIIQISGCE